MSSLKEKAKRQAKGFASMFVRYRDKPYTDTYGIQESNRKKNYAVAATQIVQKRDKPLNRREKQYLYRLAGRYGEDDQLIMKIFRKGPIKKTRRKRR